MPRATGDFTRPLNRTVSPDEAAAIDLIASGRVAVQIGAGERRLVDVERARAAVPLHRGRREGGPVGHPRPQLGLVADIPVEAGDVVVAVSVEIACGVT